MENKYRGVRKQGKVYRATIHSPYTKRHVYLGSFKTAKEAALAFNKMALLYHKDKAVLNKVDDNGSET